MDRILSTGMARRRLSNTVATVDEDICTGGVRACIADQVHISALQFLCLPIAPHWNHALPQILGFLVNEVGEAGIDVAGRDAIDTGKVTPFVCQRASQVDAACLGDVVRGLFLREIGNVARHGGGDDETSSSTFLEVMANGLGTVEAAREVGLDDLVPVFDRAIKNATAGCTAGVGDKSINLRSSKSDVDRYSHCSSIRTHLAKVLDDLGYQ